MTWKQILAAAGISLGAAVGGYYAAPESEMNTLISTIRTVSDSLIPAHTVRDTVRDSTGAVERVDSAAVEERYAVISERINEDSLSLVAGDTMIWTGIYRRAGKAPVVRGLVYLCAVDSTRKVRSILKLDNVITDR